MTFDTDELIEKAVARIKEIEEIKPVRIAMSRRHIDITEAGVAADRELETRIREAEPVNVLPDILAYLQKETELTRHTLVKILKESGRLPEFKVNPQATTGDGAGWIWNIFVTPPQALVTVGCKSWKSNLTVSLSFSSVTILPSWSTSRKWNGSSNGAVTLATLSHPSTRASEVISPTLTVMHGNYRREAGDSNCTSTGGHGVAPLPLCAAIASRMMPALSSLSR